MSNLPTFRRCKAQKRVTIYKTRLQAWQLMCNISKFIMHQSLKQRRNKKLTLI